MSAELQNLVDTLDAEDASADAKFAACEQLVDAGKAAVPLLIARLEKGGDTQFHEQVRVPTGPMHAGPTIVRPVSVLFQVESLLYRIVYPSPVAEAADDSIVDPGELASRRRPIAFIEDWKTWWATHGNKSLEEIRAAAIEEVADAWRKLDAAQGPPP